MNSLPPYVVDDPQPLELESGGVFALNWPRDVRLHSLQAWRRPSPEVATALELGDAALAAGRYAEALEHFLRQGPICGRRRTGSGSEVQGVSLSGTN